MPWQQAWQAAFEAFLASPGDEVYLVDWARRSPCLPVYADWTHAFGVTSAGQVLAHETEAWPVPTFHHLLLEGAEVVTHPLQVNLAIHQGARRYPWLGALRLPRPPLAQTCSACSGTGELPPPFVCYCGGAGWVPADDTWVNARDARDGEVAYLHLGPPRAAGGVARVLVLDGEVAAAWVLRRSDVGHELVFVAVREPFRGRGIGASIVHRARQQAQLEDVALIVREPTVD